MAKKKKMSKAQAAAARKEVTPSMVAQAQRREVSKAARENQKAIARKKGKVSGAMMLAGVIVVIAIIVLAWVFTVGPGMLFV